MHIEHLGTPRGHPAGQARDHARYARVDGLRASSTATSRCSGISGPSCTHQETTTTASKTHACDVTAPDICRAGRRRPLRAYAASASSLSSSSRCWAATRSITPSRRLTVGLLLGVDAGEDPGRAFPRSINTGMRQKIYEKNGVTIIEDCYNAGPESTEAALERPRRAIKTKGRRIAVLGDMLELGNRSAGGALPHRPPWPSARPTCCSPTANDSVRMRHRRDHRRHEPQELRDHFDTHEDMAHMLQDARERGRRRCSSRAAAACGWKRCFSCSWSEKRLIR